ncbi:helix-turn-helix domain-containing protein [Selenomonas ruminantium]|uniref:helix-turn-helix domain-containing protein n=1 Tax=Selenomonas ruminantium TaxID=971 RepID=UPI000687A369|nr:helix-turn-helix transcriptional regulator [Selenomonas ruminantium]
MECLISFRKMQGLTRAEVALKLGVSHSLYEKIELGDRKPSRSFMEKFKRTFPSFDMNIFFDEGLHEECS